MVDLVLGMLSAFKKSTSHTALFVFALMKCLR